MDETGNQDSFVAHFWLEDVSGPNPIWRGHLRHVQSDEECYFQDLSAMRRFLERISGVTFSDRANAQTRVAR